MDNNPVYGSHEPIDPEADQFEFGYTSPYIYHTDEGWFWSPVRDDHDSIIHQFTLEHTNFQYGPFGTKLDALTCRAATIHLLTNATE